MSDTRVKIEGVQAFTMKMASLPEAIRKGVLRKLMREAMQVVSWAAPSDHCRPCTAPGAQAASAAAGMPPLSTSSRPTDGSLYRIPHAAAGHQ